MKVLHLVICQLWGFFDSFLQVTDSCVPFFEPISHFILHSLVLSLVGFHHFVLFFQLFLKLLCLIFQFIDYRVVSFLNILNVSCVNSGYSFFYVVQFEFILSLNHIYFLSQHADLSLEISSLLSVLLSLAAKADEQFGDFIIFDWNHFSESIELNIEKLVLILNTFL